MRSINTQSHSTTSTQSSANFMNKVYLFMTLGLLVTAIIAYYFHTNEALTMRIASNSILFYGIIIAQFAAVVIFNRTASKLNAKACYLLFFAYSALTGVTIGIISFIYSAQDIAYAFGITAGSFFALSVIGYSTKKDLSPIGRFCIMGLWGLIIEGVLAIFIPSLRTNGMNLAMSTIGVIVFAGLTAYYTQRIKTFGAQAANQQVAAIHGALLLYITFINFFLSILRFFGGGRR